MVAPNEDTLHLEAVIVGLVAWYDDGMVGVGGKCGWWGSGEVGCWVSAPPPLFVVLYLRGAHASRPRQLANGTVLIKAGHGAEA